MSSATFSISKIVKSAKSTHPRGQYYSDINLVMAFNPSDNSQKAYFQQEKVQKPMVGIALVVGFFIFPFSEKNKHTRACTVDYVYCKGVQQNN